jgi:hypothetical protein
VVAVIFNDEGAVKAMQFGALSFLFGLLNVLGFRAHRLVSVVHRSIFVVNVVSVAVIDRIRPAVIAPAGQSRPRGTCPETESWIVRIIDVIVVPPTIAVPITIVAPIVLPIVSNVAQVLLAPILPLTPVSNLAWKILYVVARASGSTDVARAIARAGVGVAAATPVMPASSSSDPNPPLGSRGSTDPASTGTT